MKIIGGKEKAWKAAELSKGIGVSLFFAFFFYRSPAALPVTAVLVYPLYRRGMKERKQQYRSTLTRQFKEALNGMLCAVRAGYSAENAVREADRELERIYGKNSIICEEFSALCRGLDSHIPLEELMNEFAGRSEIEDIREFAATFTIARRSGGNMAAVMERTIRLLQDGMDSEREIELQISARKTEQKIMDLVPFLILGYVSVTSEGFFDALYGNPIGVCVMTGCMGAYIFAFVLSEKITDIQV